MGIEPSNLQRRRQSYCRTVKPVGGSVDKTEIIKARNQIVNYACGHVLTLLDQVNSIQTYMYYDIPPVGLDLVLETSEDYLVAEMEMNKRRIEKLVVAMEQQQQLMRLMVQVIVIL